jgi:hypothetical protein
MALSSRLAGGTDERTARQVLLVAGLLADDHDPGPRRPLAGHGLGGVAPQVAAAADLLGGGGLFQGQGIALAVGAVARVAQSGLQHAFRRRIWPGGDHVGGPLLGGFDQLWNEPRLGQVPPIALGHLLLHHPGSAGPD